MDYTVYGIFQARIVEWVVFPFSRGYSQPRNQTQVSLIAGKFFTIWYTREAPIANLASFQKSDMSFVSLLFNLLEYSCFTVLYYFLLCGQVNKSYINIYPLFWISFPFKSSQSAE